MELSVMVTRRVKLANELEGALAIFGPAAAAGLDDFFAPVLDDGTSIDAATYFEVLRRKVVWLREGLVTLDLAHQEALSDRDDLRQREATLAKSLYGQLVNLRRTSRGLLDEVDLVALGLAGTVAQDAVTLSRQTEKAWTRIVEKAPQEEWPEVVTTMAARLAPDLEALKKNLKALAKARRKVESAAARKRRGIKEFDPRYLWIAKSAEMHFRMAGLEDAADRVKPKARRLNAD